MSFSPNDLPDPAVIVEAKLTALVIAQLRGCIRYFAPEGVSDEAISIRAFEVARDASRMEPDLIEPNSDT